MSFTQVEEADSTMRKKGDSVAELHLSRCICQPGGKSAAIATCLRPQIGLKYVQPYGHARDDEIQVHLTKKMTVSSKSIIVRDSTKHRYYPIDENYK